MGASKTSRRRIDVAERRRKLLELRKAGLTYQEIVDQHPKLGYKTPANAAQDATRALRALLDEPARDVVALEVSRLDALTQSVWRAARTGDLRAVDRSLRIMERRARLLGLDYADRNAETQDTEDTRSMLEALSEQLADAARSLDDPPPVLDPDELQPDLDPEDDDVDD